MPTYSGTIPKKGRRAKPKLTEILKARPEQGGGFRTKPGRLLPGPKASVNPVTGGTRAPNPTRSFQPVGKVPSDPGMRARWEAERLQTRKRLNKRAKRLAQ